MIFGRPSWKLANETTEFIHSKNQKFPFFANFFCWKFIKTCFTFRLHNKQTQKSVFGCFRGKLDSFRIFKIEVPGTEILKLERIYKESKITTILGMGAGTSCLERLIAVGGASRWNVGLLIGLWLEVDDDTAEQVLIIKIWKQKIWNQRPKLEFFLKVRSKLSKKNRWGWAR